MFVSMIDDIVFGENRDTGFPNLSTKNFVKFHLIPLPKKPPPCRDLRNLYNGSA